MSGWRDIDARLRSRGVRFGYQGPCQTDGGPYPHCGHVESSGHYKGWSRDYGNADSDCRAVVRELEPFAASGVLTELFYAPTNTWWKNGKRIPGSAVGDHLDHVHATIDPGKNFPLVAPPPPPPPPVPKASVIFLNQT